MNGKLERNTSTPELKAWWDAVHAVAANAPRLEIHPDSPWASTSHASPPAEQDDRSNEPEPPCDG